MRVQGVAPTAHIPFSVLGWDHSGLLLKSSWIILMVSLSCRFSQNSLLGPSFLTIIWILKELLSCSTGQMASQNPPYWSKKNGMSSQDLCFFMLLLICF